MEGQRAYVVRGGSVCTMDPAQPWAECLVVDRGRIVHVGSEDLAPRIDGAETIDLRGGMVLPGFIDAHNHLASAAVTKLGVNLSGVVGRRAVIEAIAAYAHQHPDEDVLRGYAWMPDSFEEGGPRREWLDEVTGGRPMVLYSADSHDLWFNTAAMVRAGVGRDTPDPVPGTQYFKRDADGMPSGWAVEAAQVLITVPLGVYDLDGVRAAQSMTIDPAPGWGLTAYFEAGVLVGPSSADAEPVYLDLVERDRRGELPLRIVGSAWTRYMADDPADVVAQLTDWNARLRSEHVQVSVCKMWADGVMMSGGALLLQPFCNHPGDVGRMTLDFDQITRVVEAVQRAGFDMHIHVDADGSARTVLDAIEAAQGRIGRNGGTGSTPRHAVAHNSMVDPSDIPRYAANGILANCTPLWGTDYNGQYLDIYTQLIGPDRIEDRLFPYGDLVRSGAVVTYGADIPGVDIPETAPLIQMEAAVTRRRPGHPEDRPLGQRQRVDLHDALKAYTVNAAHQLRMEDRIGMLREGMRADLVTLEANLFDVPASEIHAVPVTMTMMDGVVTHRGAGS